MKIALAQQNFWVGDIEGNTAKLIQAVQTARAQSAKLVVFSELSLIGYPPEDLLFKAEIYPRIEQALTLIKNACPDCYVVVGYPEKISGHCFNTASVIYNGKIVASHHKRYLPNYAVFDEERYFNEGTQVTVFDCEGVSLGLVVCEDIWYPEPAREAVAAGAQGIIVVNASPYDDEKYHDRIQVLKQRVAENDVPLFYVNQVCGQDELIFDGRSLVMNAQGEVVAQAPFCAESLLYVEVNAAQPLRVQAGAIAPALSQDAERYAALKFAVHDYVIKNGFQQVFIGLSGGIDSAIVLAIAVDALGADKVTAVTLPSPYTARMGIEDAYAMAQALQVDIKEIGIGALYKTFLTTLTPLLGEDGADVTTQNIQARIRGVLLMALANKFKGLVLTTSNKSEVAVGYATLYGDMAGGFDVLKDVYKTDVYRLSRYRNQQQAVIPERIITRAPTAELAPNQMDQDDLPLYEILDQVLRKLIEGNLTVEAIIRQGFDEQVVEKVATLLKNSEYKRRQSPIGPRLTTRSFGKDWRFPVVNASGRIR